MVRSALLLAMILTLIDARASGAATSTAFGVLDEVSWTSGKIHARGWAIGDGADPVSVHVYVDGSVAANTVTNVSRPDVAQAFPGHGDKSGFSAEIASSAGSHTVCAYALTDDGRNPLLACRTIDVPINPFGTVDALSPSPGGLIVRGWALDPDAPSTPVDIHVYVDGVLRTGGVANENRPDVGNVFSYGAMHGYSIPVSVGAGAHQVCAYGLNVTGSVGVNMLLACRATSRTGDPVGYVTFYQDAVVSVTIQSRRVEGYLIDPDTNAPVDVHIYSFPWNQSGGPPFFDIPTLTSVVRADGQPPARVPVEGLQPLVATFGTNHGFSGNATYFPGISVTCAYAVNTPGTPGSNFLLGCTGHGPLVTGPVGGPFA